MAKANAARGEFEIELGGATYGMRPAYEAIEAIEAPPIRDRNGKQVGGGTGRSAAELYAMAERSALPMADAKLIVTECIKAWGKAEGNPIAQAFSAEKVGPLIMETTGGMMLLQQQLKLMLFMVVTGGMTAAGKAKAAPIRKLAETTAADAGSAASPAPRSAGRRKRSG